MIKILLVDHYCLVRSGMRALLDAETDMEVTAEAGTGEAAVAVARTARPDVVLLNTDLPGMGSLEITRRLRRLEPAPRVIALGAQRDGPLPTCFLEVGARGYLTKTCEQAELVAAIRRVARGGHHVGRDVAQSLVLDRLRESPTPMSRLTPRELAVMVMVSQGQNRTEISSRLCVSPKTISTYRTRLMRKLGATSDVQLTHLSITHGLIESSTNISV